MNDLLEQLMTALTASAVAVAAVVLLREGCDRAADVAPCMEAWQDETVWVAERMGSRSAVASRIQFEERRLVLHAATARARDMAAALPVE